MQISHLKSKNKTFFNLSKNKIFFFFFNMRTLSVMEKYLKILFIDTVSKVFQKTKTKAQSIIMIG